MKIWIVRKHPRMPYWDQPGHLAAFTIHGTYANRADAANEAKERNKRSSYLFTVSYVELREKNQRSVKPWVGLTDVERAEVQYEAHKKKLTPLEFMELHEAKLKEKNGF